MQHLPYFAILVSKKIETSFDLLIIYYYFPNSGNLRDAVTDYLFSIGGYFNSPVIRHCHLYEGDFLFFKREGKEQEGAKGEGES